MVRPSNATQRSGGLQRFFSTFPGGWPGYGLLLLRAVVGLAAAVQGVLYLANAAELRVGMGALGAASILGGLSVLAGFLTPGAGAIAGSSLVLIALWNSQVQPPLPLDLIAASSVMVDAVALVLLGPGAFSVDAHLFGRREIVIPPETYTR